VKGTGISAKVRRIVLERDGEKYGAPCCIFCGSPHGLQIMHYIPRSQGGRGIPENLACGCVKCHGELDNGKDPEKKRQYFREYLKEQYPGWNESELKVRKE